MHSNLHLSETKVRLFARMSSGEGEREEVREPFALVAELSNQDTQCFNGIFLKSKLMKTLIRNINKEQNIKHLNTDRICSPTCMLCPASPHRSLNPAGWSTLLNARSILCAWDFPSDPVVKTSPPMQGVRGRSLIGKLRSHISPSQKTKM